MPNKDRQLQTAQTAPSIKNFFQSPAVKSKFEELMGKRASAFITSALQAVNSNELLKNADPVSIYAACCVAASLDLPVNNSLGFCYLVPYNDRKTGKQSAQLQLGYKAWIQLCQRSGKFLTISAAPVYEGQIKTHDPLTGFQFDWENKKSDKVIGYASYFKLINGFDKTLYMSLEDIQAHAKRYSQTYKKGFGIWVDNFEAMALKTVLKLLLSKYGPVSIDIQKAELADGGVVKDSETMEMETIDAEASEIGEGVPFGDENEEKPTEEEGTEGQDKLL